MPSYKPTKRNCHPTIIEPKIYAPRVLNKGEVIIQALPDFVAQVFYRKSDVDMWMNDTGLAFGDSIPNTTLEIRKALTWLVTKLGGKITWESGHA